MDVPSIFADFHNTDPRGRVRLNTIGTVEDLSRSGVELQDGLRFVLHDDELEADATATYSADEHLWVAQIDWAAVRSIR